jgi:hypothetical protein
MGRDVRRAVVFLFAVALILAAASLLFTSREVGSLRKAVLAQCKFDRDVGSVPVSVNPATHAASKLGVSLIADARQGWHGLGCPGVLPPPQPSFVRWARHYHLPAG